MAASIFFEKKLVGHLREMKDALTTEEDRKMKYSGNN